MKKELTLPSGKKATIRKPKGRDLLNAQRTVRSQDELSFAILAQIVEIEGAKIFYEDLLEMDMEDVLVLQEESSPGK